MLFLYTCILISVKIYAVPEYQFNIYRTVSYEDGFCLLYYVHYDDHFFDTYESKPTVSHQIIPHCLRLLTEDFYDDGSMISSKYTFEELREKNISSQQLLSWSAAIELVEEYEIFLNNPSNISFSNESVFYNCTSSWFGPFCRFTFDFSSNMSLHKMILSIFTQRSPIYSGARITCYEYPQCQTLHSFCLDWRDICDRKVDCLDESDELNCWQIEINECGDNEYRCHNGQCIPAEFFHDGPIDPDCLDRTDEPENENYYHSFCYKDVSFRCEEHTCRPGFNNHEFPCGDGACSSAALPRCFNGRSNLLYDDLCSRTLLCFIHSSMAAYYWCQDYCFTIDCLRDRCQSSYEYTSSPMLFGHVYFIFSSNISEISFPTYVCYNEQLCREFLPATVRTNNLSCRYFHELDLKINGSRIDMFSIFQKVRRLFQSCFILSNETIDCNHTTLYQCQNSSKCISKHRLLDGMQDCPLNDDEIFNQSCSLIDNNHQRFSCLVNGIQKCFSPLIIQDNNFNCDNNKDERHRTIDLSNSYEQIHFQMICNGIRELEPIVIDDGTKHTDETECDVWECNNTYTRCNQFWSCRNGADEMHCSPSLCPDFHHECIFLNDTSKVSCLPMPQAGDNIIDCLGATDERDRCLRIYTTLYQLQYQCHNESKRCYEDRQLCDGTNHCPLTDDESFCMNYGTSYSGVCYSISQSKRTPVEDYFCRTIAWGSRSQTIYFQLGNMPIYPQDLPTTENFVSYPTETQKSNEMMTQRSTDIWRCNRGFDIRIRMNNQRDKIFCLCPPSYYGDRCQYQNERVSLTMKIEMTSNWRSIMTFVIILFDHEKILQSFDYIDYLSIRDCKAKFHIYLLYLNQKKKTFLKNYFIEIHAFNKETLTYQGSWIYPLRYSFLPVHRLSILLVVSILNKLKHESKCTNSCFHGQCLSYINEKHSTFCFCDPGWSGVQCNIQYQCHCASDSLCLHESICICPMDRFGPRCVLRQSSCHSTSCLNHGQCIPADERRVSSLMNKIDCICPQGFIGDRCQYRQALTQFEIKFHSKLSIPLILLIHLITVHPDAHPTRTSLMKKIPIDQDSLSFSTSIHFSIAFAEMDNDYYLIALHRQTITTMTNLSTQVVPTHRCASIDELFDKILVNQHLIRRIKKYHLPCKQRSDLVCFYDEIHMCLCDLDRRVNCFRFEHKMTYNCRGYNLCENDGHCFQDDKMCPTLAICVCRECFYGSKCQFSTTGATLSLDTILAYQIRSNTGIHRQPLSIKILIGLTIVMFVLGVSGSLMSYFVFRTKKAREVGCGFYLTASSIVSIITMSFFLIKFWILLLAQTNTISNRLFIRIQCIIIDYFLRILLSTNDWLSACVSIERTVNVFKGVLFNKIKSRKLAKKMIVLVCLLTISTQIYDPVYRRLVDDTEEQRTWCVTQYSSSMKTFDWIINLLHFSIPFLINLISAVLIIFQAARNRSNAQKTQTYREHLSKQFQHHRHLLISSFILVLLAVPRLIISFLFGCMKSVRNPWLYLTGYYVSFVSPMLMFIIFILPSKVYKTELKEIIRHFRHRHRNVTRTFVPYK